jgi:ligand-binding SRPBCC domain-containing protein
MKTNVLERTQLIPRPRHEVFDFFSRAANLEKLTPDNLRFSILTPEPIPMHPGTLIDYRIKLSGVPMTWRTKIDVWEPETRFVDIQLSGPYKLWRHEHTFKDVVTADGRPATEMGDRLTYAVGFGPLGVLARALFVDRTVEGIFDYRKKAVEQIFGKA